MDAIKTYLTEITTYNEKTDNIEVWAGPEIQATSEEEAESLKDLAGLGYCKIVGVVDGIGTLEDMAQDPAPFPLRMDFDINLN